MKMKDFLKMAEERDISLAELKEKGEIMQEMPIRNGNNITGYVMINDDEPYAVAVAHNKNIFSKALYHREKLKYLLSFYERYKSENKA